MDFMGLPKVLVACDAANGVVLVTSQAAFDRLKKGDRNVMPIGFRVENVFRYDGANLTEPVRWEDMTPWVESDHAE